MYPQNVRLLIGEDDPLVALDMQQQLLKLGYEVQIRAGTPREVISLATKLLPDLLILDLHIGGDTHGVEVARDIRDMVIIPIVFISAFAEDMSKNAHAVPRPYRYVTKPFVANQIHSAIQELLA